MLTSLTRAWRICSDRKERTALANRLGPHLARDIGLEDARAHLPAGVLPPLAATEKREEEMSIFTMLRRCAYIAILAATAAV